MVTGVATYAIGAAVVIVILIVALIKMFFRRGKEVGQK